MDSAATAGGAPVMADRAGLTALPRVPSGTLIARVGGYVALTKPRIIELLLITTVPTMMLAARGMPPLGLVVATVAGGTLAAGGANAANMVYDRDIDAVMRRTKRRPLVTGVVSPRGATIFALGLEAGAFALLWSTVNLLSALLALGAAAFYVGIYTALLKRSTRQNIVIGGAAGAVPVLVGWSAVTGRLSVAALLLFAVIFLWTPPHFWALAVRYREDYGAADVPMLPAVTGLRQVANQIVAYAGVLCVVSLLLAPAAGLGPLYLGAAAALGVGFAVKAWGLRADPSPKRAMGLFHYSISYLTLLFVAIGVDAVLRHR